MKFISALIAVRDMDRSKRFYSEVLDREAINDFGANVMMTGGIALQTLDTWKDFIHKSEISFGHNSGELYFEVDDMDAFAKKLSGFSEIEYVHKLTEHAWGQRVIRFYDPDRNIIEVGENMSMVVRRFVGSGLTVSQTATRMDVSEDYVLGCICE